MTRLVSATLDYTVLASGYLEQTGPQREDFTRVCAVSLPASRWFNCTFYADAMPCRACVIGPDSFRTISGSISVASTDKGKNPQTVLHRRKPALLSGATRPALCAERDALLEPVSTQRGTCVSRCFLADTSRLEHRLSTDV